MIRKNSQKGFTLIELLIVIAIIGFLASAILVAVDPVKRIQDARDTQRYSEVRSILNAVLKKQVDERSPYAGEVGAEDDGIEDRPQVIVEDEVGVICNNTATRPGCDDYEGAFAVTGDEACVINLAGIVDEYIASIPVDPMEDEITPSCELGSGCDYEGDLPLGDSNSGYWYDSTASGRITIGACHGERDDEIWVKR